jgi:membrane associated rhomboid family serine protease
VIPIRDDNPTTRFAWVTLALIAVNVVVFLAWQPTFASGRAGQVEQQFFFYCHAEVPWETTHRTSLAEGGEPAVDALATTLNDAREARAIQEVLRRGLHGPLSDGERVDISACPHKSWWQSVFVAMFLHEGWLHIGGNMLFLWIFGNNVEDKLGRLRYLLFYLLGGIAATVAQTAISPGAAIPSLGASGAIAAVLGAYLVMFPRRRVLTLVFFFFITMIELPAILVLGGWFLLQVFSGVGGLGSNVNGGVAYFAHIGGFALGIVAALLFFPKERRRAPRAFEDRC